MQIPHIMHAWHLDHTTWHASAIMKTKHISPPKKGWYIYIIQVLQIVQILQIMQTHPRKAIHHSITVYTCMFDYHHAGRADPTR